MTSKHLVLRPSTKGSGHPGSLSLRLIHNRHPKTITLKGCRLMPQEWDMGLQAIIYPENDPRRRAELEGVRQKIDRELEVVDGYVQLLQKNGYYTTEELTGLYREKKNEGKLLGYVGNLTGALEKEGQRRLAKAYRSAARKLTAFNGGEDIPLGQINGGLIRGFGKYLKHEGLLPNTAAYYMRNLRAIYNKAAADGLILRRKEENPFAGISTAITKTMKRALSVGELQTLFNLDFDTLIGEHERGNRARDAAYYENLSRCWRYFNFCVFARGMCFIDLAFLRKDNIRGGVIRYCRKKTGQFVEIRITREIDRIIRSFAADTAGSPYVFPLLCQGDKDIYAQYDSALRTQNNRLKALARLAGIDRNVSTHVARHSWASACKSENIPTGVISECLGHTSEDTTEIYLARLNNRVLDDANDRVIHAITFSKPAI